MEQLVTGDWQVWTVATTTLSQLGVALITSTWPLPPFTVKVKPWVAGFVELAGALSEIEVGLALTVWAFSCGARANAQRPIRAKLKNELPIFIEISSKETETKLILGPKKGQNSRTLGRKTDGDAGGIQQCYTDWHGSCQGPCFASEAANPLFPLIKLNVGCKFFQTCF